MQQLCLFRPLPVELILQPPLLLERHAQLALTCLKALGQSLLFISQHRCFVQEVLLGGVELLYQTMQRVQ